MQTEPPRRNSVSLLTDFERCDDYLDWDLGTHGIYVEFANPALNLPSSQLPPLSTPSTPSNASTSSSVSSTPLPTHKESYRSLSALPKLKLSLPASANPRRLPTVLHATFLPEVAPAQGWSKVEAVDAALRKAGFKGVVDEELRKRVRVSRYQSRKVKRNWDEWQQWRKERV
jgi:AMMECR1 domain-containing protein